MIQQQVTDAFQERFKEQPAIIVRAPGRVNLIGEHTDYNDGFVLPMAIDRAVMIALRPRDDSLVQLYSLDFGSLIEFDLTNFPKANTGAGEYVKGVAWALQEAGHTLKGWEGVMKGDVPIGSGLSSSAALELAVARAFSAVSNIEWDAPQMALLGQKVENQWMGLSSGIMDQMISATGQANHAVLLDCRSLERERVPLPSDTAVVVLDTSTRRGLVDSAYNERQEQCQQACQFFGVSALRDVTIEEFEARASGLDDLTMRRARHVIIEDDRTLQAKSAMLNDDPATLGKLMNASHVSLRDDYEVSSEALDTIVECAQIHSACYGARMTGAGFGGCAVALVKADGVNDFIRQLEICYTQKTNLIPQIYVCHASEGASIIQG